MKKRTEKEVKFEAWLKRVLELSGDAHNIFTPFELCEEVIAKIPSLDGKILVVANLEFLYTLSISLDSMKDVYFATPNDLKAKVAIKFGIPESNIIRYDGVIKEEDVKEMKFDVVCGNPPYQDPENTNTKNLWPKFIKLAFAVTKKKGYVALITPRTWVTNVLYAEYFLQYNPIFVNLDECARHFPGVGSTFSYYVIQKCPADSASVTIVTPSETFSLSSMPSYGLSSSSATIGILNKLLINTPKFVTFMSYCYHTDKFSKNDNRVSRVKTKEHTIPVLHKTFANKENEYFYASTTAVDPKQQAPRVIINTWKGRWNDMMASDEIKACQTFIQIETNTIEEALTLKHVLMSRLYRFIMDNTTSSTRLSLGSMKHFPIVDLSRTWTDEELYEHFSLTDEEIQLIEDTIS